MLASEDTFGDAASVIAGPAGGGDSDARLVSALPHSLRGVYVQVSYAYSHIGSGDSANTAPGSTRSSMCVLGTVLRSIANSR